jgi:rhodanese-related sulfurtransferase
MREATQTLAATEQIVRCRAGACAVTMLALLAIGAARSIAGDIRHNYYCGIYSIYAAASALNHEVDFETLLSPSYVSSPHGSTLSDLVRAARHVGLHCAAFSGVDVHGLRWSRCPVVLHVAAGEQLRHYGHWIVLLGFDGPEALVVDASDGASRVPITNILARWDGVALFVDRAPISAARVRLPSLLAHSQFAVALLGLLIATDRAGKRWLPWRAKRWRHGPGRLLIDVGLVLLVAALAGMGLHAAEEFGVIRHPEAAAFVAAANSASFIPKHSLAEARSLHNTGDVLFVDARFARDYAVGHIPGAINLPINANQQEREAVLSKVDRDKSIVVYCQSVGCAFDEAVATSLIRSGFRRVSLFPGGWLEWSSESGPSRHPPTAITNRVPKQ